MKAVEIPLGELLPDQAEYNNPGLIRAHNCYPTPGGYGPFAAPRASTAILSDSVVRGAARVVASDGTTAHVRDVPARDRLRRRHRGWRLLAVERQSHVGPNAGHAQFNRATFGGTYIEVWIDGQAIHTDRGGTNGLAVSGFYWASGRAPAELHNGRVRVFYNAGKDPIPGGASLIWGNTAGVEGVKTDLSPNAIWRDWPLVTVSGVPDVCVVNSVPDGLLDAVPFDGVGLTHLHRIQKAAGTPATTPTTIASIASDGSPLLIAIGNRSNTTQGTGGITGLTLDGVDISSGWLAGDQVLNSYMDVYLVESPPVGAALNLDVTFADSSGALTGQIFRVVNPNAGAMIGAVAANSGSSSSTSSTGIVVENDASLLFSALHTSTDNQITAWTGGSLLPDETGGYAAAFVDQYRKSSLFIGANAASTGAGGITAAADKNMAYVLVEIELRSAP